MRQGNSITSSSIIPFKYLGKKPKVKPSKIISVVPSFTETLAYLHLNNVVIGITRFCIHPHDWFKTKTRVGGTKDLKLDVIKHLNPDLIIANKEENEKQQVLELSNHYPVLLTDIQSTVDVFNCIREIGNIMQCENRSEQLIDKIKKGMQISNPPPKTVIYLIWKKPYMAAGKDTFIHNSLKIAGFENVIPNFRYPKISISEIKKLNPDVIFLSSEPFPFKASDAEILANETGVKTIIVDGEIFSWYGARLQFFKNHILAVRETINA